jgi:predicted TIM-barrel fold metal-dependent hydrolase
MIVFNTQHILLADLGANAEWEEMDLAVEASTTTQEPTPEKRSTLLIDADVHERPPKGRGMQDLIPYIDPHWARYLKNDGGTWPGPPGMSLTYTAPLPEMVVRKDWIHKPGEYPSSRVENMISDLIEGEGVTTPIINGPLFFATDLPGDPAFAVALAKAYNDWQIAEWLDPEPRLCGSVHVAAQEPEHAAEEIDRAAEHPRLVQVILPLSSTRQFGDPVYRPIWEAAVRNRLAVAFHHSPVTGTLFGFPRYYIEWHTAAAPQAAQNQAMSLICNGVFDRYPELKVVMLEAGVTWLFWLMWRLDQQYKETRANVPWVKRLPSEHIRSNVRGSTQPITEVSASEFVKLVEMTQSHDAFVFASDYPHYDADSAGVLNALPEDFRNKIRYENALDTYPRLRSLLEV